MRKFMGTKQSRDASTDDKHISVISHESLSPHERKQNRLNAADNQN